ncbi:MAG: hypothetical protein OXU78_05900 [Deltaproteobacteria bacterium]|nr:hypothetical protein [Deltaproteobacteria bacterium]
MKKATRLYKSNTSLQKQHVFTTKKKTTKKNYTLLASLFDLGSMGVTSTTAFFIVTFCLFAGGVSC